MQTSINKCVAILLILFCFIGCGKAKKEVTDSGPFTAASKNESSQRDSTKYLAYEYYFTIDLKEDELSTAYQKTLDQCNSDEENNCTVLDARISKGPSPSATIHLRIEPKGVKGIVKTASSNGEVVDETTHVEDLAAPIIDNEKRQKMLMNHLDRLMQLQQKATNDIESFVKISEELSKVNAELEEAKGNNDYLLRRVNMDIVDFNFQVKSNRSFWKPISNSLSQFSSQLSDGISDSIRSVAYLIPWAIIVLLSIFGFRYLWRVGKKTKKSAQQSHSENGGNGCGADE